MLGYDWPRLHAALNDLPAALLVVGVLFDLASAAFGRPALRVAGFWTVVVGAVGAGLAVLSGLQAEEHIAHGSAVHEAMETHERFALITLGIFAVVAVWRIVRESRMGSGERTGVLVLSVVGTGVLLATASLGGKLVFDHAAGIATPVLEAEIRARATSHHHHEGGEDPDHADSAEPTGHTHAPGTPPHQD